MDTVANCEFLENGAHHIEGHDLNGPCNRRREGPPAPRRQSPPASDKGRVLPTAKVGHPAGGSSHRPVSQHNGDKGRLEESKTLRFEESYQKRDLKNGVSVKVLSFTHKRNQRKSSLSKQEDLLEETEVSEPRHLSRTRKPSSRQVSESLCLCLSLSRFFPSTFLCDER